MNPTFLQFLQTVVFPALALAATGIVGLGIAVVKKHLDRNTEITAAAAEDQTNGFRDIGKWRYEINERLTKLETQHEAVQRRVERIPTGSQWGYRRSNPQSNPLEDTDKVETEELIGPTPPKIPPVK